MSQQQDLDTSDVFNIVQEKIIELQWKTVSLINFSRKKRYWIV